MEFFQTLLEKDLRLTQRFQVAERPGKRRAAFTFLARSGDSWFWLAGLAIVWFQGNPYWRSRAVILGFSIIVTAAIVMAIKFSVRRRRPEGQWGEDYRKTDPHSFPSGHASRAFMLVVIGFWLGPAWLGWILLLWAPLVTLARVAMGVHYLSDVVFGALFGLFMGWFLTRLIPHLPFLV